MYAGIFTFILFQENTPSVKTDVTQVRSLLVLELMTLQLFYNFQNHTHAHGTDDLMSTKAVLFSTSNQDMMLRSMEGLLEVQCRILLIRILPTATLLYTGENGTSITVGENLETCRIGLYFEFFSFNEKPTINTLSNLKSLIVI